MNLLLFNINASPTAEALVLVIGIKIVYGFNHTIV